MSPSFQFLLTDPDIRKVFEVVATSRQVLFRDLLGTIQDRVKVRQSIDQLKRANLVREVASPSSGDFGRVYVTADGLRAERQLQSLVMNRF